LTKALFFAKIREISILKRSNKSFKSRENMKKIAKLLAGIVLVEMVIISSVFLTFPTKACKILSEKNILQALV